MFLLAPTRRHDSTVVQVVLHEYLSYNWHSLEDVYDANRHLLGEDGLFCTWSKSMEVCQVLLVVHAFCADPSASHLTSIQAWSTCLLSLLQHSVAVMACTLWSSLAGAGWHSVPTQCPSPAACPAAGTGMRFCSHHLSIQASLCTDLHGTFVPVQRQQSGAITIPASPPRPLGRFRHTLSDTSLAASVPGSMSNLSELDG